MADQLYAQQIQVLPGAKVRFTDSKSGRDHEVILTESILVQATKQQTINIEKENGKESSEE